jgi:hypothetical protein
MIPRQNLLSQPENLALKDNAAYTIFFDQANNKVSEGKVLNKLFEGPWKYYHQASKSDDYRKL